MTVNLVLIAFATKVRTLTQQDMNRLQPEQNDDIGDGKTGAVEKWMKTTADLSKAKLPRFVQHDISTLSERELHIF